MIQVEAVTYRYPKSVVPVFSDFFAEFRRGEITAVTGKNGCGKTTLTKLLVGILRPSLGYISIDGSNTSDMDLSDIGRRVGYVFQNPNRQLFCDTVYNEVAFGLRYTGLCEDETKQRAEHFLDRFDLKQYRETYPGKLSLGEKQRLALAAVMALATDYLVLDEPTTGHDARRQRELGEALIKLRHELDCGIVLVSHETDFIARYADRELLINIE